MKKILLLILLTSYSITYSQWNQTLNGISIWSLAKDLQGNIYAGSLGSSSALYKTTNFGNNWLTLTSGNGQTVFSIAVDSSGNIFAANFSAGMLISTNSGANFTTVPVSSFGSQNVQAVACGKNGYVYAGTNGGGMYRSTNNGVTWIPTNLTSTQVITIAVDRFNSSVIYAGTTATSPGVNGFYRSTDYGATFSANTNPGINVYGIVQPNSQTLVTVSTSTGGPVHRSTDGGLNWVIASTGYISRSAVMYNSTGGPAVYIAGNGGVFYSFNNGTTFTNAGLTYSATPLATALNKIFTGVSGSSNGGAWIWTEPLAIEPVSSIIPEKFSLIQNYPNPFNPSTTIKFMIPLLRGVSGEGGRGVLSSITIYNSIGQKITELFNQQLSPGTYSVDWDASNYPSGLYFYTLTSGDFTETKKMILLK